MNVENVENAENAENAENEARLSALVNDRPLPQRNTYSTFRKQRDGKVRQELTQVGAFRPFEGGHRWSVWSGTTKDGWSVRWYFTRGADMRIWLDGAGPVGEAGPVEPSQRLKAFSEPHLLQDRVHDVFTSDHDELLSCPALVAA